MVFYFDISGTINAETIDDAIDIIKLTLEDNGIFLTKFVIGGEGGIISICKEK